MNFAEFFTTLKEARFGFGVIRDAVVNLYYSITENPNIQPLWTWFMDTIAPFFMVVIVALIAFSVIGAFFGQKMMGFLKFLAFLTVGFFLGVQFLAPVVAPFSIPAWIVGLVVGIVASVLSKFLYFAVYAVAIGYSTYIFTYWGFFLTPTVEHTSTRALFSLAVAVAVVIVAFIFRRYVEMIITAAAGGYMATMLFVWYVYNFLKLPFLAGYEWIAILVVSGIVALLGFITQFSTRRRY